MSEKRETLDKAVAQAEKTYDEARDQAWKEAEG